MHIPPPVIAAAAGTAQRVLAPRAARSRSAWLVASGVASIAAALGIASLAEFRQVGTTIDPARPSKTSALVRRGPYRLTRNPMYLALAGGLLAHALTRRAPILALIPIAGYMAAINRLQIRGEEAALRQRFGIEYDEYRRSTPRWI